MDNEQQNPSNNGEMRKDQQLESFRTEHKNKKLTTNQGVRVSNTDDSLKAGDRGPTLMEKPIKVTPPVDPLCMMHCISAVENKVLIIS